MVLSKEVFLLILQFFLVEMLKFEKPVAKLVWPGRCTRHERVLNDCNWCRCTAQHQFKCDARNCGEVDMFGHFNDAIQDINVGMEGHGFWRSKKQACEPLVQYRRDGLLCVCTENGNWPNPVCRDVFRILHSVETTGQSKIRGQKCSSSKLYLIGCNVCFCPSTGRLDPELCTTMKCSENDPVLQEDNDTEQSDDQSVEIYAGCQADHKYKLGCKACTCLRNNRLLCGNCALDGNDSSAQSFCKNVEPGLTFSRDCNLCYCDQKGFAYCTTKQCLPIKAESFSNYMFKSTKVENDVVFDEETCIPGRLYKRDCNECSCFIKDGMKYTSCTLLNCGRTTNDETIIQMDCVKGTVYELNCYICHCNDVNGVKAQVCHVNPRCAERNAAKVSRSNDLSSLHGYCEPLHVYKNGCNTCHCLSDGKTVRCTSYVCKDKVSTEPVSVDIVPIIQNGRACPKGLSYRIDCNYCFCLSNGNAICTTSDCRKRKRS